MNACADGSEAVEPAPAGPADGLRCSLRIPAPGMQTEGRGIPDAETARLCVCDPENRWGNKRTPFRNEARLSAGGTCHLRAKRKCAAESGAVRMGKRRLFCLTAKKARGFPGCMAEDIPNFMDTTQKRTGVLCVFAVAPPHGERGLKYVVGRRRPVVVRCSPSRGAGIEIMTQTWFTFCISGCSPSRGAGIVISESGPHWSENRSRFPRGERGLKWELVQHQPHMSGPHPSRGA